MHGSYYRIGKTHKVCQDYTLSGENLNKQPFCIVSDGCSSSPDTDFGSRILCKNAELLLKESCLDVYESSDAFLECLKTIKILSSVSIKNIPGLEEECLDCSLLFAYKTDTHFRVVASGDGSIVVKHKGGGLSYYEISYKDNAPEYLNYINRPERHKMLKDSYDCTKTIKFEDDSGKGYERTSDTFCELFDFPIDFCEFVAISSDGISTFYKEVPETYDIEAMKKVSINPVEVAKEMLNFKTTSGQFVERRCTRMFKDFDQTGIYHSDDFSVGVIG